MAKIIEAKAVISAQDNTGAVFDKIAKKIDGLAKSAKTAKAVDEMARSIDNAKRQMVAIDQLNLSRGALASSRQRFNEMKTAVESAARAISATSAPTREMEANLKRTQVAVSAAARAYERQKDAAISHKRALEGMGVNVSQAAAHQTRLRAAVERTSIAMDRQLKVQERSEGRRVAVGTLAAAGGAFAAHALKAGTKAFTHTYREFDSERRFGKAVMGITDEEQAPLVKQAIHGGATTKYNDIQFLHGQRDLAARGVGREAILGMMPNAANLGMATDQTLPDAVKLMESGIFTFKKDVSSVEAAARSSRQTADVMVKAMKISGMTPDDIAATYKFGAPGARMAGMSEQTLLGFGGVLKKAGIGGDESGVAFRALMATIQAPTAGAKTAMLANGMNYKNYQSMRDHLEVDPFAQDVAARYGVKLDKGTRAGLGKLFSNKDLISDPAKFNPAVTALLREQLGGSDAKSLKSISGAANRYRDASVQGVDANRMTDDLMAKLRDNLKFANAMFGSKQGSRIATALSDPDTFNHMREMLKNDAEGYAEKISKERMSGFDGAVCRFQGAKKNLETSVGRSLDNDGKGGLLTKGTDAAGQFVQWLAERDSKTVAGGAIGAGALGLGASGFGAFKFMQSLSGGFGLNTSAGLLDAAAKELMGAAGVMRGGNAVTGATAASTAASGGIWAAGAAALPWVAGAAVIGGGIYAMRQSTQDAGYGGLTSGQRLGMQRGGSLTDARRRAWNSDRSRLGVPALGGPQLDAPGLSPTMTFGTGVPGDRGAVTAQLSGSAVVGGEVTVNNVVQAGSELLSIVAQAKQVIKLAGSLNVNANGPGSTGRSSPDAAAPVPMPTGASGDW